MTTNTTTSQFLQQLLTLGTSFTAPERETIEVQVTPHDTITVRRLIRNWSIRIRISLEGAVWHDDDVPNFPNDEREAIASAWSDLVGRVLQQEERENAAKRQRVARHLLNSLS